MSTFNLRSHGPQIEVLQHGLNTLITLTRNSVPYKSMSTSEAP